MYFNNYFRVYIFVYLLSINFARVLIVYFQNIVYSFITINFTVSYVKISHIYMKLHAREITAYTFVTSYEFACTRAVYSTFLNASTDTVSIAVRDQNCLREWIGAKPGHAKSYCISISMF